MGGVLYGVGSLLLRWMTAGDEHAATIKIGRPLFFAYVSISLIITALFGVYGSCVITCPSLCY